MYYHCTLGLGLSVNCHHHVMMSYLLCAVVFRMSLFWIPAQFHMISSLTSWLISIMLENIQGLHRPSFSHLPSLPSPSSGSSSSLNPPPPSPSHDLSPSPTLATSISIFLHLLFSYGTKWLEFAAFLYYSPTFPTYKCLHSECGYWTNVCKNLLAASFI